MRILIDALGLGPLGGARKSFLGWIRAVSQASPDSRFEVYLSRPEPSLVDCSNLTIHLVPIENRFLLRLWAQVNFPLLVKKNRPDLFHAMKNLGTLGISCPNLITINDLHYMVLPELFSHIDRLYWKTLQAASVRRATHLIAISQNTKRDLSYYLKIPPYHVTTIYPAVEQGFNPIPDRLVETELRNKYKLVRPFILYVGGWAVHKNLSVLLAAYCQLASSFSCDLVIVGGRYHSSNERIPTEVINDSLLQQRVHLLGVIPDRDMPHLYRMADIFAMPSLNEGFGIALLEAMASGVPAIASKCGSLPEVGGEAVRWVLKPKEVMAWKDALFTLNLDSEELTHRRELGLRQAAQFSWERTGKETNALYSKLLSETAS